MNRMRKINILLLNFATTFAFIFWGGACSDNSSNKDASNDVLDISQQENNPCNIPHDPLNPAMRMNFFDTLLPANLNNPTLENLMIEGFYNGDFIWLLEMNGVDDGSTDTDGKFHLYTGSGIPVGSFPDSNCFRYRNDPRWPDAEANVGISGDDISWINGEPKINITVPVFKTDPVTHEQNLLLTLPLKDVVISSGKFNANRTAIGAENNCATANGGVLEGMITVEDAKNVVIQEMGLTLCGLLSGDKGTDTSNPSDDCAKPISQWPQQPDGEVNGQPAFKMSACFSATSAVIIK